MDKKLQENIIKYAIGAGLAYFLVARPILMKLGILKSDKQTSIENETLKIDSAFNPNYWKQFSGPKIITDIALNDIINIIQDSFGVISDNYDAVLAQFKKLSSVVLIISLIISFFASEVFGADRPPYIRTIHDYRMPDVTLFNQDGGKVRFKSLVTQGKVVILDFIFGTCTTI